MGKVLIVRYEGTPFAIRMSKVIRTILDAGWQCDVLIPRDGLGEVNVSREMGWDLSSKVRLFEFPTPSTLADRLSAKITSSACFGSRLFEDYLTQLLRLQEYNVVMVKDTYCLRRVFRSLQRARQDRTRVVCDMYENATAQAYDHLIGFGNWRSRVKTIGRALIPRIRRIERTYLPRCDHIFVVVEEAKSFIVRRYGLDPLRVSVVHNVEILNEFDQIENTDEPLVRNGEMLVSYVGGIGPHRGIGLLIDAVAKVATTPHPPLRLAIVGAKGKQKEELLKLCQARGLQDLVHVVGFLPHRAAMQWIKQTHIGVIPHADTEFIRTTVPNKLFQYMAAGAMCLVSHVGPLSRIVRETGCGLTFTPGSADSLASQLAVALQHPDQVRVMGAKGRVSAERRYRWELEGRLYTQYFSSLHVEE